LVSPIVVRAAAWRAARSGLEGDLVDVLAPAARPATQVMTAFVDALRAQLEESGDWPQVHELANRALRAGTSAVRQRRAMQCRGELTDVVDQLITETAQR
jgi:carboxylate-amine ligase